MPGDEFCQDMRQYIGDLLNWKDRLTKHLETEKQNQCCTLRGRCESTLPKFEQRHGNKSS